MINARVLASTVEDLAAIPYFPQDAGARAAIGANIAKFVEDYEKLRWLVDTAVAKMRTWQGIPELRGLYCTRFKPVDNEPDDECTIAGYTPEDSEARYALETSRQVLIESLPYPTGGQLALSKQN